MRIPDLRQAARHVRGSNITPDHDTGIGAWSEDDIKRLLTLGVRPQRASCAADALWLLQDGHVLKLPKARQRFFSKMTEQDLNAIVAWVRTIPPIE
jgi:hypothetical protein